MKETTGIFEMEYNTKVQKTFRKLMNPGTTNILFNAFCRDTANAETGKKHFSIKEQRAWLETISFREIEKSIKESDTPDFDGIAAPGQFNDGPVTKLIDEYMELDHKRAKFGKALLAITGVAAVIALIYFQMKLEKDLDEDFEDIDYDDYEDEEFDDFEEEDQA